ncbi:transporter substrate-binding domain-containing protein [Motilimonas sp. 1_MG-2023]|nr:transporter substrate-binding domain-containing protein [Motilimonas sp. 1_MG-2023]
MNGVLAISTLSKTILHMSGLTLILSLPTTAWAATGPSRLMLTTQDWPPYQVYQDGEMRGTALNKVKCALGKLGQPYQLTMTSWQKAQLAVQSAKQDGFFVAAQTQERDEYATLSTPIAQQRISWYFATGVKPLPSSLIKLDLRVSAKFGSNKWFELKRGGYNVVKKPRDAKTLLKLLKNREIDAILEDELVFKHTLKDAGLKADYFQSELVETLSMGVYFSNHFIKQYPDFLGHFNAAVSSCEK